MKTLKLFNAVLKSNIQGAYPPYIDSDLGLIIEEDALWVKERILDYYRGEQLNGNDLNKTFHKSWKLVKNSTREELALQQIQHYLSTYGTDFQDDIYLPEEVLNIPELKLTFKIIKSYSKEEMIDKCLNLLKSGMALKAETITDLLSILVDELDYTFTGTEGIRNKEAIVLIADLYGVYPYNTMDFLRYIIYKATGEPLIIKSDEVINKIKESHFNPTVQFKQHGLERLAEVFNRFKPIFLAFKSTAPVVVNKISRLSKKHHKPMIVNPLNTVTSSFLQATDLHWLDNATPFALFKALSVCYLRITGQNHFVHKIRNGKSWTRKAERKYTGRANIYQSNYEFILTYLQNNYSLKGKKIYIPHDIKYGLPTSEKMFVGNIPTGTKFYGKKLAAGIYWENSWGANDLDISGLNLEGKVGWNSSYNQGNGALMYSGDITNAPNGAVEYLYANKGLTSPSLVVNSVYSGDPNCQYKIIVGKGDKVSREYMMDPNNLVMEATCNSVQNASILGMFIPEAADLQSFVLLNLGAGHARVSGNNPITDIAREALYQEWNSPFSFNELVTQLDATIVVNPEEAEYDFSLDTLEKDSFVKLFVK